MNKLIENIPQRWNISKLKYFSDIFGRIGFRGYTASDLVDEGEGAITLGPPNIENQKLNLTNKKYISWEKYYESPEIQISNGDILLVKTASVGKVALVENLKEPTTINPQLVVFKNIIINPKFFYYSMISDIFQYQVSKNLNGGVISTLSQENIQNYSIPIPPNKEQKQIANYLDKKTSKIDTTIAKNKELINLLEEKRTALINQVVTKGLNPEVPMKDSGIEWIGEIPEHWEIKSLKNVVNIIMGQSPDSNDINDEKKGFLFMQGNAEFTNLYPKPSEYCTAPKKISREGDILMSVRAPVGELNISDKRYGIGRGLCSIKAIKVESRFLWYYLIKSKGDFNYYSNGSTFDAITISNLSSFPISIPPLHEQNQITSYLDKETSIIDKIIDKIKENINLLEEYKTSLIHHVVTGKIDVRGEEI